jgi:hypothetical protein
MTRTNAGPALEDEPQTGAVAHGTNPRCLGALPIMGVPPTMGLPPTVGVLSA